MLWAVLKVNAAVRAQGDGPGPIIVSVKEISRYCHTDRKTIHTHIRSLRKVRILDAREHSRDKARGLYTIWVFHGPPDRGEVPPDPQLTLALPPKR